MTQSKKTEITSTEYTFDLDDGTTSTLSISSPTVDNNTYTTADTGSYTVSLDTLQDDIFDTGTFTYDIGNNYIDCNQVEKMLTYYPSLDIVWKNFKSVYDMCIQDYKGKQKAGEIDDDIPF